MKRAFILLLVFVSLANTLSAQLVEQTDTGNVISFYPLWDKGTKHFFEITKDKTRYSRDSIVERTTTSKKVEMEILKISKKGYTVQWKYDRFDQPMVALLSSMGVKETNINTALNVVFVTNADGTVLKLLNYKELHQKYEEVSQKVLSFFKNKPAQLQLFSTAYEMFNNETTLTNIFMQDVYAYHHLYGSVMTEQEEYVTEDVLDNGMTRPMNVQSKYLLYAYNAITNRCKVSIHSTMNEKDVKEMLDGVMKQLLGEVMYTVIMSGDDKAMALTETYDYEFDTNTGLILGHNHQRDMLMGPIRILEKLTIKEIL